MVFIRCTVEKAFAKISARETLRKSKETELKYISVKEKLGGGSWAKVNDLFRNFRKVGEAREDKIPPQNFPQRQKQAYHKFQRRK